MILSPGLSSFDDGEIQDGLLPARHGAALSPDMPDLSPHCLHVWRVPLDRDTQCISSFAQVLSADEIERMRRYKFDKDRNRFVAARGALRYLLGAYLGTPPQTIVFSYGIDGKPDVKNSRNDFPLHFNISHSHDLALMAFVLDMDIGIDIEKIRATTDVDSVADVFFSAPEKDVFEKLSDTEKKAAFYRYWTSKEAYMKARGKGMKLDSRSFAVSIDDDRPGLASPPACDENRDGWRFSRIDVGTDYEAVVVNSDSRAISISLGDF